MKMLRLVVVLTLGVLPLCAQKSPKEQAQVWIGITCSIYAAQPYSLAVTSGTPGEDTFINTLFYNNQGLSTAVSTGERLGRVYPGRLYTLAVGCAGGSSTAWTTADLHFNVPEGYVAYVGPYNMGRTPSSSIQMNSTTMGDTYYCNFEIRPEDGLDMLPAGYSRPPTLSAVTWGVSLGRVSGGGTAGALRWRFSYLSADALNANNLIFADPINSEVFVVKYSDNLAIRYIDALDCQVTVIRNSDPATGYTLNFYKYDDIAGSNLDFPGVAPYATYVISTPGYETYNNRVQITRTMSGSTDTWIIAATSGGITLTETNSSRILTTTSTADSPVVGQRTEVATISEISSAAVLKTTRVYQSFPLQEELIKAIADPDGLALTTLYEYGAVGTLTKLKSITHPNGAWEKFDYYSDYARLGQLARVYTPWLDAPSSPTAATLTNCKVTTFDYVGERSFYQDIPAGVTTAILGTTTGTTTVSATFDTLPSYNIWLYKAPMRTETSTAYSSASAPGLVTVRKLFTTGLYPGPSGPNSGMVANPDLAGRLYYEIRPDGTKVSASYNQGSFMDYLRGAGWASAAFQAGNGYQCWCETYLNGTATQTTVDSVLVTTDGVSNGRSVDPIWLIPFKSTRRQLVRDSFGNPQYDLTYVFNGSGYNLVGWTQYTYGTDGLLYSRKNADASLWTGTRTRGQLNYETNPDGTQTQYYFDAAMRTNRKEVKGAPGTASYPQQVAINTAYAYDAADRILTETTTADTLTIVKSRTYSLAGLLLSETDEKGIVTNYTYTNGNRTVTKTIPTVSAVTSDTYLDGSPRSVTGNGTVEQFTERAVITSGTESGYLCTTAYVGTNGGPRWTKTYTDWLGRTVREEKPATNGGLFQKTSSYNAKGQLEKQTEPGVAPTYYGYNGLGERERMWIDVNNNASATSPLPDLAGPDRITETKTRYVSSGDTWWLQTLNYTYTDGSAIPVLMGEAQKRLVPCDYGFAVYNYDNGVALQESKSWDLFRNYTFSRTVIDRPALTTTVTTDVPDSTTDEVKVSYNGLPQSVQSSQNLVSRAYYDALRRLVKQTDPRTDPNPTPLRIGYYTSGTGQIGQKQWQQDSAGNQTNFFYNATDGRLAYSTDPLGKATRQSYNERGQVVRTWGDATYPVEYSFNVYGEQQVMSTFRDGTAWTGTTWPSAPGTADTTTWNYEAATGLLLSKTDAANKSVVYTYTSRGQLSTRAWARGVTTTYTYDAATAEQTGIAYSDSTPNLGYAFNRLGQNTQVADAALGTWLIDHCFCGKVIGTTLPAYFDGRKLTYALSDLASGVAGRTTGFNLSGPSATGTDYAVTYGYDTYGRFNQLTAPGSVATTYSYRTDANLIASITDSSGWAEAMTYEANRDLITSITGAFSGAGKAVFGYVHDALGRRTSVAESGEIFNRYTGGGLFTKWSYDDRSEVTGAQSYFGTNIADTSQPIPTRGFGYAFDNIGSRTQSTVTSETPGTSLTTAYTNNALNQVTTRTAPASTNVTGLAPGAATVTINGATASRYSTGGDFFYKTVTAASTPAWQTLAVASSYSTNPITRYAYLAATPESYTYDLDGNLLDDGRWHYTWDAENRLTSISTSAAAIAAGAPDAQRVNLSFVYDYLGRRVRKTVAAWNGSAFVATVDRKFIYDGWNLIAEHDVLTSGTPAVARYAWGLDLSKTLQDGGGVGGLLAVYEMNVSSGAISTTHLPAYDGNGNVHALINRSGGAVTAAYEYDAFGQTLRATGSFAASNPFRFSTKYTDSETGLLYYGRRYYNPTLGRWLGRDPIEEKGGLHLYGFVGNNGVNKWDVLGMEYDDGAYWDESCLCYRYGAFNVTETKPPPDAFGPSSNTGDLSYTITIDLGGGGGSGGGGGGDNADGPADAERKRKQHEAECAGIAEKLAQATEIRDRNASYFNKGGQYADLGFSLDKLDSASLATLITSATAGLRADTLARLASIDGRAGNLGTNYYVDSRTASRAWNSSAWSNRIGVVGGFFDGLNLGRHIANGNGADALFAGGNAAVDIIAPALGPLGVLVALGQAGINAGMFAYTVNNDIQSYLDTLKSAAMSEQAKRDSAKTADGLSAQYKAKGCP